MRSNQLLVAFILFDLSSLFITFHNPLLFVDPCSIFIQIPFSSSSLVLRLHFSCSFSKQSFFGFFYTFSLLHLGNQNGALGSNCHYTPCYRNLGFRSSLSPEIQVYICKTTFLHLDVTLCHSGSWQEAEGTLKCDSKEKLMTYRKGERKVLRH